MKMKVLFSEDFITKALMYNYYLALAEKSILVITKVKKRLELNAYYTF